MSFYSKLIFCLLPMMITGCTLFQKRDLLEEMGIKLGNTLPQVQSRMGEPKVNFSFSTSDHDISVWVYDAEKVDYQPGYVGDDYGVLAPKPGIRSYEEIQYRFIFVDGYLCSIEDFVHNEVYTVDRNELPDNIPAIIDEIHSREF